MDQGGYPIVEMVQLHPRNLNDVLLLLEIKLEPPQSQVHAHRSVFNFPNLQQYN